MSTTAKTTYLPARSFDDQTPLITRVAVGESFGSRYQLTTADNKNLVLTFKDVQAKCCVDAKNRPFLVVNAAPDSELLTKLNLVRSRLVKDMGLEEAVMRPILTAGRGLMKRKLSLFLNITANATLTDQQKNPVDYTTLVGKECKLSLFIHLHSVFKNLESQMSIQFKVCHLILQEVITQQTPEVEQVVLEGPEDYSAVL